jgi:hypothetical protein
VAARFTSGGALSGHGSLHRGIISLSVIKFNSVTYSTLYLGLGFVWKSFGNLKNAVRKTASLKNLKLLKYSLTKVSTDHSHCPTLLKFIVLLTLFILFQGSDLNLLVRNALAVSQCDDRKPPEHSVALNMDFAKKLKRGNKSVLGDFETIKDFYFGLEEAQSTNVDTMTMNILNPQPARSYVLELLDEHWERAANDESTSLNSLWKFFNRPEIASSSSSSSSDTFLDTTGRFPATEAIEKLTDRSDRGIDHLNLRKNPDAIRGLLAV